MKKFFIFLCAATLMAVACNKSETVVTEQPNELGFRAISGNLTKGAELTGTILTKDYGIYAAATQKNASGLIENPSFFAGNEQLFGTAEDDVSPDTRLWHAGTYTPAAGDDPAVFTPTPLYWPIGGVKMDFLAYAMKMASRVGVAVGDWKADWDNYTTDVASQVSFKEVDTYVNQEDVLYAYANGQTSSANAGSGKSVKLTFEHAQAMLMFNIKVNAEAVKDKITVHEINFLTPDRIEVLRSYANERFAYDSVVAWTEARDAARTTDGYATMTDEQKAAWDTAYNTANPKPYGPDTEPALADRQNADVMLNTVGTFTVNNTRNILQAGWTYSSTAHQAANYRMPVNAIAKASASNSVIASEDLETCFTNYGSPMGKYSGDKYFQLGDILLIPEQDKVNFTIKYEVGGRIMYYTYNDVRGVWEKGKKYIYNLDLTLNEIVITEQVSDFVAVTNPVAL